MSSSSDWVVGGVNIGDNVGDHSSGSGFGICGGNVKGSITKCRRDYTASNMVKAMFLCIDGSISCETESVGTAFAIEREKSPVDDNTMCGVCAIIFVDWIFRPPNAELDNQHSVELQALAVKKGKFAATIGYFEYRVVNSYSIDWGLHIIPGPIDRTATIPLAHVLRSQLKGMRVAGQTIGGLCEKHDATLPNDSVIVSLELTEVLVKDILKPFRVCKLRKRQIHVDLISGFPSRYEKSELRKQCEIHVEKLAENEIHIGQEQKDTLLKLPRGATVGPTFRLKQRNNDAEPIAMLKTLKFAKHCRDLSFSAEALDAAVDALCVEEALGEEAREQKPKVLKKLGCIGLVSNLMRLQSILRDASC